MSDFRFYLGTHHPHWLGRVNVPLFISRRQLVKRKSLPRASAPWALDSGGFTELKDFGCWTIDARTYAAVSEKREVRITDCDDFLVFHAAGGEILFPTRADIHGAREPRS